MLAQHAAQGAVQQVGGGMVAHNIAPPTCIHDKLTRFADRDRTFFDHAAVNKEVGNGLLDIFDAYPSSRADEQSGIRYLPATLSIERCAIHHQLHLLSCSCLRYLQTINIQCEDKRPRLRSEEHTSELQSRPHL